MSLDKQTVRNIAFLARIDVPDSEIDAMAEELSSILGFVEQLSEVDTSHVEPISTAMDMVLPWREDVVTDGGYPDQVVANAPDQMDGLFAVPKMME